VTSGVPALDTILHGGFPTGSLNIIAGAPGTGKTVLAQQFVFANARADARALYLTTLSEPRTKTLRYLQQFSFFSDEKVLGEPPPLTYGDLAEPVRARGFESLAEIVGSLLNDQRPRFLVIDSFKALRDLVPTGVQARRVMFDLASMLAARSCTTLFVGEYTEEDIAHLPELAIADGILQLVNRPTGTRDERYLRIHKLRGSGYQAGEHAFRVTRDGLAVFPRLVTPDLPAAYVASDERVPTGLAGFDAMLGGGLRRGSSTLVRGPSGSGKTLLGLHFLHAGAAAGENGLLVSFQENPSMIRYISSSINLDPRELDPSGHITSLYLSPVELNVDDVVQRITAALEAKPIRRVVIDSLVDLEAAVRNDPARFRSYLYALIQRFAVEGITSLTTLNGGVSGAVPLEIGDATYMSDNVIALFYAPAREEGHESTRAIVVVKSRGVGHDAMARSLRIGAHGLEIGSDERR
jgi:circadian clock protein KaiC